MQHRLAEATPNSQLRNQNLRKRGELGAVSHPAEEADSEMTFRLGGVVTNFAHCCMSW